MANELDSLFFFGRPLGPIYGFAMGIREKLYRYRIFKQHHPGVPVISVGNLMLGGTGKTPTVIHLARLLKENGYNPAIVSRGYGGKSTDNINVVSDGRTMLMDPVSAGDEPVLIAESLQNIPVLTGKKRIEPCMHAVEHLNVDILLLDDGFQHMGVVRDINVVLFDATVLAGNSRIFPGGPLREPVAALKRTSAFLLTGQNPENRERSTAFAQLLQTRFPDKPVFTASYSDLSLVDRDGVQMNPAAVGNAYLFCAIASPERVQKSVEFLGIQISGMDNYKDHRSYTVSMIKALCQKAAQAGATCLITTAKDYVKVKNAEFTLPVYVLQISQKPETAFNDFILQNIPGN
jgi:tetraacyldisaccharide 4'-kinase